MLKSAYPEETSIERHRLDNVFCNFRNASTHQDKRLFEEFIKEAQRIVCLLDNQQNIN